VRPEPNWIDALAKNRLLAEYSLWSADLARLADDIARVDRHVDIYHIDVADGEFSPSLLFFPDLVAACRKLTGKPFHVHLMMKDGMLEEQVRQFAESGADLISVHAENLNARAALDLIASLGLPAGLVLQLHTDVASVEGHLEHIRFLTLLGTRMGIKGVGLDDQAEPRLRQAAKLIESGKSPRRIVLAADGGIRENTVPGLRRAGAETIVMGSLAFGAPDLDARMAWVHAQPLEA
jgi:ribulose-phosphate 3-epimerase